jgi:hypothetical protein
LDGSWRARRTVVHESATDRKEHTMNKALSIALGVAVVLASATAAHAERNGSTTPPSPAEQIVRQERGRTSDPRLFHPTGSAPIVVAGSPDRFDVGDAVVGGGAGAAVALLAAAGAAVVGARRSRLGSASS